MKIQDRHFVFPFFMFDLIFVSEQGYEVEIQSPKYGMTKQKVCASCARAMRGRYKVQRLPPHTAFHCAMGDGKLNFITSFNI